MSAPFSDADLEAYLDEMLDPTRAAELESLLRQNRNLLQRLAQINQRRDAGVHTLSEIWRQNRIGVPTREQVRGYLLGTIDEGLADYIHFRVEVLRCRYTSALLEDVELEQKKSEQQAAANRRKKYIDSSAGLIRRRSKN